MDFEDLDSRRDAYASSVIPERLQRIAEEAGARQAEIQMTCVDSSAHGGLRRTADMRRWTMRSSKSVLTFSAVGRPAASQGALSGRIDRA